MDGKKRNAKIVRKANFAENKHNLKISFLPSERNLLSSIQNIENLYRSKEVDVLFNYILEWGRHGRSLMLRIRSTWFLLTE